MPIPEVEPLLKTVAMSRTRFLFGLDCVPDDRLTWSAGGAAKTPLQLAGKFAGFLGFITHMIVHGAMPDRSGAMPPTPQTREEAKAAVDGAFEGLRGALRGLTEGDMQRSIPAPWRADMSMRQAFYLLAQALAYHQGQLNLLQLCWGDEGPNVPPGWGSEEI